MRTAAIRAMRLLGQQVSQRKESPIQVCQLRLYPAKPSENGACTKSGMVYLYHSVVNALLPKAIADSPTTDLKERPSHW
jgi:hypothetical protein